jgi:translation initiation factor 1
MFRGAVVRPGAGRPKAAPQAVSSPAAQRTAARVRVAREIAGRGGKTVSVISGLPLNGEQLESMATRLKRLCGAGGAVKEGSIEIQGEHRDRLVKALIELGYDAKKSGG